ncbi:hypothetical protein, partial [Paraburkholderia sp.]|uniref:hypothetical protein n=1 Tax=Paraburkholderia sp. TaxID=1926495 RepID=UPI002D420416
MSTQTILGHSFPTPCKRCGGALYRQVDYCPYCGAVHPLDASPHKRVVIPGSRASAMSKTVQKNGLDPAQPSEIDLAAQAALTGEAAAAETPMQAPILAAQDVPIPPLADLPRSGGLHALPVRRVLLAIVAIGAIGLAYVAYALFSDNHESQNGNAEQNADNVQDARTASGTIALYAPAQSTNQAGAVKPAVPTNPAKAAPAMQITPVAPPVVAAPAKPTPPQFRDAAQALQAAHLAFRANDLSTAQAALGAAQTLQPGNTDAQSLLAELRPLAAHRDAALQ